MAVTALIGCCATLPATGVVPIQIVVTPVPLDADDPGRHNIGSFAYAGGIEIRSQQIHELSDLRIVSGNHLVAVSDQGFFFEARLLLDPTGRLSGLADPRVIPLKGRRGERLTDTEADAEGLALLPNGDRLVSFERNHRIWLYPADGSRPRPVPQPKARFPPNEGMEAITTYPAAGPGAYLVGSEGGDIWLCSLFESCRETPFGARVPPGLGLTALAAYGEDGSFAMLGRTYSNLLRGVRITVRLISTTGSPEGRVLDEMSMSAPLTVDNFEGIDVVPRVDGLRLYLVSDDNGSPTQRTYLLAFDWKLAH
jgi:hypothetical protein